MSKVKTIFQDLSGEIEENLFMDARNIVPVDACATQSCSETPPYYRPVLTP